LRHAHIWYTFHHGSAEITGGHGETNFERKMMTQRVMIFLKRLMDFGNTHIAPLNKMLRR